MNVPFAAAGALALAGAAIHGLAGHRMVLARLPRLEPTPFGGASATRLMIVATWHIATIAFASLGAGLVWCAASGGPACTGVGRVSGLAFGGFSALVIGLPLASGASPRMLLRHPAPALLSAVAALAWWGA